MSPLMIALSPLSTTVSPAPLSSVLKWSVTNAATSSLVVAGLGVGPSRFSPISFGFSLESVIGATLILALKKSTGAALGGALCSLSGFHTKGMLVGEAAQPTRNASAKNRRLLIACSPPWLWSLAARITLP